MLVLSTLLALAGIAHADDKPPQDIPVRVTAKLHGASAMLTARFDITFDRGAAESALTIELPPAAVVTGARVTIDGTRHVLALVDAAVATAGMEALQSAPPAPRRAWSVAVTSSLPGLVAIDIAAPRRGSAVLELAIEAPTCWVRDARHVRIPTSWQDALDANAQRTGIASYDDLASACGDDDDDESSSAWFALPDRLHATGTTPQARVRVDAGRLALTTDHFAHATIELPRELSVLPADLRTAIVVDASRSLSTEEREAQRAIVAAYLAVAPRGRVQVIAYARDTTALLPAWTVASKAAPAIDKALRALTVRNGSNIDAGVADAAAWLRHTSGTRRMLVFSDELLSARQAAAIATLAHAVPAGTTVHTIALGAQGGLARDDSARLEPFAAATTGIAVSGGVDETGHVDATMLARPIAIDHLTLDAPGWKELPRMTTTCEADRSLDEGTSCTWWGEGAAASGDVTFRGLVWNRRFERTVKPDVAQGRTLARVFSALGLFSDDLGREIDRVAAAVNAAWSLYAAWGGTGGYSDIGVAGAGYGATCGCGPYGTIGHGGGTGTGVEPSNELRDQLEAAVGTCHGGDSHGAVALTVETTLQEIVDVEAAVTGTPAATRDCIIDAVWNLALHLTSPARYATSAYTFRW